MTRPARWGTVGAASVAVGLLVAAPARAWPRSTVDGDVDRTIEQVLREPAFTTARPSWLERLRDDVRQWFFERLATLFESGAGTVLAWTLVGLAAVVGVLVVVRAMRDVRRGAVAEAGAGAVTITRRPAADWLADARAAREAGDPAEAVRCGYRAVVAGLASSGGVDEVPGRTVGEYRAQVREHRPELLDDFVRASDVFERVWYARRGADPHDVATVLDVAARLAPRRSRPAVGAGGPS